MIARSATAAVTGICLVFSLAGCDTNASKAKDTAKPAPPAKVSAPVKEDQLATVTLVPEAEKRLGIETVAVERRAVPRTRTLGGEVTIPPGRTVPVSAPLTGTLEAPKDGSPPLPGARVKRGQTIFVLEPLLTPDARAQLTATKVEADGLVDQAEDRLKQAEIALERAKKLRKDNLVPQAAVIDAQVAHDLAVTTLRAAQDRRDALAKQETGSTKPIDIVSPGDGMLRTVHAQIDQKVQAGALLFEVLSLDSVWIRVPIYVDDEPTIDKDKDAGVGALSDLRGYKLRPAHPTTAPPSGDPMAITVDLFYEVENKDGALRPGQRVGVSMPLKGEEESLVVPRSAVVIDLHGGEWVYENTGPHAYARRRVEVDHVVGPDAVLARGPRPGAKVVITGAAELFGTEFGGAK